MFSGKAEIIANTKEMMELVCNTDALDKEVADYIVELNIISEQMQSAILENGRVALNQEEYEKGTQHLRNATTPPKKSTIKPRSRLKLRRHKGNLSKVS